MTRSLLLLLVCAGTALTAQMPASDSSARTAQDSVVLRAKTLASNGREGDARKLLDSTLKANSPDSAIYAEALYWRGALATTAADAERDYRRLLIEVPLSARAEDAMLQLAQLLQARGDRRGASDYLQRFMLTYANSAARPRVALTLVRLLFEQGPQQLARACDALRMGRDAIPPESLELRNQLDFYAPRCLGEIAVTPAGDSAATQPAPAPHPAPPASGSAPAPSTTSATDTSRPSSAPAARAPTAPAPAPNAYYSVQLAAYDSPEPARRLARLLTDRGIEARVDGAARPFRVRVGKFTTRADAVRAATSLKAQGHDGFITLVQGGR